VISIRNSDYTQVKVSVDSRIADTFKACCLNSGVSMASVLSQYMAEYSDVSHKKRAVQALDTKRQRRAAIGKVILQLEHILRSEEAYRERIPVNLQASTVFDAAEQWVSVLEDAIDSLASLQ
jgi:hypothetical protein